MLSWGYEEITPGHPTIINAAVPSHTVTLYTLPKLDASPHVLSKCPSLCKCPPPPLLMVLQYTYRWLLCVSTHPWCLACEHHSNIKHMWEMTHKHFRLLHVIFQDGGRKLHEVEVRDLLWSGGEGDEPTLLKDSKYMHIYTEWTQTSFFAHSSTTIYPILL